MKKKIQQKLLGVLFSLFGIIVSNSFFAQKPKLISKTPLNVPVAVFSGDAFLTQGSFIIRSARDYRYLTIKDVVPVEKSQVFMWEYAGNDNQQIWKFIPQPGGFYKIKSESGFYLSQKRVLIPSVELESNEDSQLWKLTEKDGVYFTIESKTNQFIKLLDRRNKNSGVLSFSKTFQNSNEFKWQLIKWKDDGRKMTSFNPSVNGFKFANTFRGIDGSMRYGGLCGGMVYASLDYLNARKPIPTQTYKPANRTPLQSFIYGRQANSAQEDNWDKWEELRLDFLGTRDAEFFEWGIRGFNGGRLEELKRAIDAGKHIPLGLYAGRAKGIDGFEAGDHQVLAIGYAMGRYTGNLQGHPEDFKIFVYNPNYPNKIMTIVPDMKNKCYLEVESGVCYRSYFVNSKYKPKTPPDINSLNANEPDGSIRHIYATFETGSDDLRGGNDNVHLTVNYKDGSSQTFNNVNGRARWVDNNEETVPLILNRAIRKADIASFKISTTFGGGIGGDNWNLNKFYVTNGGNFTIVCANCEKNDPMPMVRFTGDKKTEIVLVK